MLLLFFIFLGLIYYIDIKKEMNVFYTRIKLGDSSLRLE
jgi:hypothetical protein